MITVSTLAASMIENRSYRLSCRATITLGGTVLLDNLPITGGSEEFDNSLSVPERVTVTVPRELDGRDLIPTAADSPLAPFGQRLHIKLGVGVAGAATEWIDRGEFLIWQVQLSSATEIQVTAVGLLALIDEARLAAPWNPRGTYATCLRTLLEPAVSVSVSTAAAALDASAPSGLAEDEDRIGAAYRVLDAWRTRMQQQPAGHVLVVPADEYTDGPDLVLLNQDDGSRVAQIIEVGGALTRDGLYNTVVVRGQASDGNAIYGVAQDVSDGGPTSRTGYFNPLPVPFFAYNPLITAQVSAQAAAVTMLQNRAALQPARLQLDCVPDPRVVGNDQCTYVASADGTVSLTVIVDQLRLPYTADSGPMVVTVREV